MVDAVGAVTVHVLIEPAVTTAPAGETDGRDVAWFRPKELHLWQ